MSQLDHIRPTNKSKVIDLVRAAGHDVQDWSNSKRGGNGAASNPKYCYEWAYVQSGLPPVLNLWHDELSEAGDTIVRRGNFRADAEKRRAAGRSSVAVRRGMRLDDALKSAVSQDRKLRVILNAGYKRPDTAPSDRSSSVKLRKLDEEIWTLSDYDPSTGDHVLTRGLVAVPYVDQFSLLEPAVGPAARTERLASVYRRSAEERGAVLIRAQGLCELCRMPGFALPNGQTYLETHHIVPLSEDGADRRSNMIALCPNHHREAHYGRERDAMRTSLLAIVVAK